ncbi:hypothetical protein [Streptomyces sp. CBMA29]|uniref:hypothetical protein n=1 Tax=Streptomyces sp. CBMA29 TaxID=1896314 RepID=UPI001661E93E|nr:hypothetical protein [Streptomyces sp. CBMA29]MBD0737647.1 hypothetical protein [Streptomyces sp. CBMA29]
MNALHAQGRALPETERRSYEATIRAVLAHHLTRTGTETQHDALAATLAQAQQAGRDPKALLQQAVSRWDHCHVSAVLTVKQLHPASVGTQQHTIWEHPDPEWPVPSLPMWRRSTVDAHGTMHFVDPAHTPTEWFGLTNPWPIGMCSPRQGQLQRGHARAPARAGLQ